MSEDTFRSDDSQSCPECGGPVRDMQHDGRCYLCGTGELPQVDVTAAARRAHLDTAAMLRKRSYLTKDRAERRICIEDAAWHERAANA